MVRSKTLKRAARNRPKSNWPFTLMVIICLLSNLATGLWCYEFGLGTVRKLNMESAERQYRAGWGLGFVAGQYRAHQEAVDKGFGVFLTFDKERYIQAFLWMDDFLMLLQNMLRLEYMRPDYQPPPAILPEPQREPATH